MTTFSALINLPSYTGSFYTKRVVSSARARDLFLRPYPLLLFRRNNLKNKPFSCKPFSKVRYILNFKVIIKYGNSFKKFFTMVFR
jgi:hypothetical protein